jgi:hypothetical protein
MKSIIVFNPILLYLFAVPNNKVRQQNLKGRNIWYIDGYNVLGHTGTTNNVTSLTDKLLQIESRTNTVVLVLDGPKVKSKNEQISTVITSDTTNTMNATTDITSNELLTTVTSTTTIEMLGPSFRKVILGDDLLADDYIIHDIQSMQTTSTSILSSSASSSSSEQQLLNNNNNNRNIVQVVTADRKLRNDIMNIKPNKVRGIIHPVTFWKRYLPRLCGMKKNNNNNNNDRSIDK